MPLAATPLRYPQPFLTPKTLDLLVIDDPSLGSGVVIRGTESPPRMVLGVAAKPGPQLGVGISGSGREGFVALGSAVLPGRPAGEPLADPQQALEVTNGCPPAFRA